MQRRSDFGSTVRAMTAAALLALGSLATAAPVALVTDIMGTAQAAGEPLKLLAEIDPGRELVLAAETTVVVFYLADGSEWTLRGPGRYRLVPRAPESVGTAAPAQRRQGPPAYKEIKLRADRLQQGGLVMRSGFGDEPMALLGPVRGETVLGPDVRFRWTALDGAGVYQFELVDQAGQKLLAAETPDNELALPSAVALKPGQTYYWAVRGRSPTAAQPLYRVTEFRVLDAATRRRIDAARPKADAPFSERALFIALLEDIGARGEAAQQRVQLAAERPVAWAASR